MDLFAERTRPAARGEPVQNRDRRMMNRTGGFPRVGWAPGWALYSQVVVGLNYYSILHVDIIKIAREQVWLLEMNVFIGTFDPIM
jgi:hypothetical protein